MKTVFMFQAHGELRPEAKDTKDFRPSIDYDKPDLPMFFSTLTVAQACGEGIREQYFGGEVDTLVWEDIRVDPNEYCCDEETPVSIHRFQHRVAGFNHIDPTGEVVVFSITEYPVND